VRRTIERTKTLPFGFEDCDKTSAANFNSARGSCGRRDEDGTIHAPHLVVLVLMRGLLRHLVARKIYLRGKLRTQRTWRLKLVQPSGAKHCGDAVTGKRQRSAMGHSSSRRSENSFFEM